MSTSLVTSSPQPLGGVFNGPSLVHLNNVTTALNAVISQTLGTTPNSSNVSFQAGSSTGTFLSSGGLYTQISAAGLSPGAIGADNVIAIYSIPASTFDVAGRNLDIIITGSFAANAHNKDIKIIFNPTTAVVGSTVTGGTTIVDTGVVATNGGGWVLSCGVAKYGAAASNTQLAYKQIGGLSTAPALLTATESGAILIAITGNATTTASDILLNLFRVTMSN